jgi:hypothetical protein
MVPSHPFNEMKPNSGSTQMELSQFTHRKTSIAIHRFSKSRAIASTRRECSRACRRNAACFIISKEPVSY